MVDLTFGVEDDNLTVRDLIPAFPFAQKSLAYMFLEQGSSDLHLITPYEIRVSQSGSLKEEQIDTLELVFNPESCSAVLQSGGGFSLSFCPLQKCHWELLKKQLKISQDFILFKLVQECNLR